MFDKLMFWKKKDDLGLDFKDLDMPRSNNDMPGLHPEPLYPDPMQQLQQFSAEPAQRFQQPPQYEVRDMPRQQPTHESRNMDIELVSSKLDTLKVMMENISNRLANLEAMAQQEKKRREW